MGMRCIKNKRLGAALTWFLRSKVKMSGKIMIKCAVKFDTMLKKNPKKTMEYVLGYEINY